MDSRFRSWSRISFAGVTPMVATFKFLSIKQINNPTFQKLRQDQTFLVNTYNNSNYSLNYTFVP
jgi:hypothetical protein